MNKFKRLLATSLALSMLSSLVVTPTAAAGTVGDPFKYDVAGPQLTAAVQEDGQAFTYNEYTGQVVDGVANADVVGVNREAATTATVPYHTAEVAVTGAKEYMKELSEYYQLLTTEDAEWDLTVFQNLPIAESHGDLVSTFMEPDYVPDAADGWKGVTLPCSWTRQGDWDFSVYTNTIMPWQLAYDPDFATPADVVPLVPSDEDSYAPVGFYRETFTVNDTLQQEDGRVYISLQGVESAYYLYINGHEVGYSEDSYRPHDFDITDYLNDQGEENTLALRVHKFSDGTWMEDQDMIYDGGIFRDVYIYSKPLVSIQDYTVVTDLDADFVDANLELSIDVENLSDSTVSDYGIDVNLIDAEGNNVFGDDNAFQFDVSDIESTGMVTVDADKFVEAPELWSAEHPNLYTLVITLYDKVTGKHMESISQVLGFREITFTRTEVDADYNSTTDYYETMTINGQPLLLKGTNRHDSDPIYGKYVPRETLETDVELMKAFNINALRTSHYSNDEYLYYLADTMGLYVMGETNAECHALINDFTNSGKYLTDMLLDREETSVQTLKNQTSIIMWSIGNEMGRTVSDGDGIFAKAIWHIKDLDPTRPVHSEGQFTNGGTDLDSNMYPSVEDIIEKTKTTSQMPYVMCEYVHAMGNSCGSVKEYWDAIRLSENMLGGFVWDWVDQSRALPIEDGDWDYYATTDAHQTLYNDEMDGMYFGYGGDFGDATNNANFCANGLVSPDRDPQPELYEIKYQYQNFWFDETTEEQIMNHQVSVYNESNFTNLNEYTLAWELVEDGAIIDSGSMTTSAAPKATETITIPFQMPTDITGTGEYYLNVSVNLKEDTAWAEAGHSIAHEQFLVPVQTPAYVPTVAQGDVVVVENSDSITVSGASFSFDIMKDTGAIADYAVDGEIVLEQGPIPNFHRGVLDNDKIGVYDALWQNIADIVVVDDISIEMVDDKAVITTELTMTPDTKGTTYETIVYTVDAAGAVTVDITIDATQSNMKNFLKVGTQLTMPSDYENVTWYGNGPVETYNDRSSNAMIGQYDSTVSDFFYPFIQAQDCGNLTELRWMAITSDSSDTGLLIAATGDALEGSALHFTGSQLTDAAHPAELVPNDKTYISMDLGSRGTGSASCGFPARDDYVLSIADIQTYGYTFVPFTKGDDTMELSKNYRTNRDLSAEAAAAVEWDISKLPMVYAGSQYDLVKAVQDEYDALDASQKALISDESTAILNDAFTAVTAMYGTETYVADQSNNNYMPTIAIQGQLLDNDTYGTVFQGQLLLVDEDGNGMLNNLIDGKKPFTIEYNMMAPTKPPRATAISNGRTSLTTQSYNANYFQVQARTIDDNGITEDDRISYLVYAKTISTTYHSIAVVYDGDTLSTYVDGVLAGSAEDNSDGGLVQNDDFFAIGYDANTKMGSRSSFSDFRAYDKALTADEIAGQYAHTLDETVAPAIEADDDCVAMWLDFSDYATTGTSSETDLSATVQIESATSTYSTAQFEITLPKVQDMKLVAMDLDVVSADENMTFEITAADDFYLLDTQDGCYSFIYKQGTTDVLTGSDVPVATITVTSSKTATATISDVIVANTATGSAGQVAATIPSAGDSATSAPASFYDLNGDHLINWSDVSCAAEYYGHTYQVGVNDRYDVSGNEKLDSADYLLIYANMDS